MIGHSNWKLVVSDKFITKKLHHTSTHGLADVTYRSTGMTFTIEGLYGDEEIRASLVRGG